jgi:molybdopterin converting factor subunit 1
MSFRLLAFGVARETIGTEVNVDVSEITDVRGLRVWLFDNHPQLTGLNKWAVAVNEKYADDSVPIFHGDVVAIIPPVSGG